MNQKEGLKDHQQSALGGTRTDNQKEGCEMQGTFNFSGRKRSEKKDGQKIKAKEGRKYNFGRYFDGSHK